VKEVYPWLRELREKFAAVATVRAAKRFATSASIRSTLLITRILPSSADSLLKERRSFRAVLPAPAHVISVT
jgi:hypothetical protein